LDACRAYSGPAGTPAGQTARPAAHGAAVVIGTLADTLGRQTAPLARELAYALWGPDRILEPTIGALMQTLRRRLLAQGSTLGMSLVAFGEADWLIDSGS